MAPKMIDKDGARVVTGWPLKLHRYDPGRLPDPADMLDCLLIVNDRTDGIPRGRPVCSNGASYDQLAFLSDLEALQARMTAIENARSPALPALALPQPLPVLDGPIGPTGPPGYYARALTMPPALVAAEVSRQIATLQPVSDASRVAALEHRVAEQDRRLAKCEEMIELFISAAEESEARRRERAAAVQLNPKDRY